jgi:translation initiation factor IF-2
MRLHELAKQLGVSSKEIMDACRKEGFEARSHFRAATPEIILAMNKVFGGRTAERVAVDAPPERSRSRAPKKKADGKDATASEGKKRKEKKAPAPPREGPKRRNERELEVGKRRDTSDEGGEAETPDRPHVEHHAHRHKRADFRKPSAGEDILPAEPSISDRYADSIYGPQRRGSGRRRRKRRRPNNQQLAARSAREAQQRPAGPSKTSLRKRETTPDHIVELEIPVTPRDLSAALGIKLNDIIRFCMNQGMMVNINDPLPEETVELIALENEKEARFLRPRDVEKELEDEFEKTEADETKLQGRSPVVAFLGHVDHGKTSLLDHIRKTRVVDSESGGITQHIGAYRLPTEQGMLCFLDTPGHEAFSSMRARGANLTDIVVLVVAADDGVMPQTREAYAHAKAAGTPVVVAINKCDLPNANPQRAIQELANLDEGLLPEEWGGKAGMIQCSAETGEGIDELVERLHLESELMELKADPDTRGEGHVLESRVTNDRGVVANVLIQNGTLHRGDVALAGAGYGKVKLMFNEHGQAIEEAGPATPVSVCGLSAAPEAGDRFYVVEDLAKAREIAERRNAAARAERLQKRKHVSLSNLTEYLQEAEAKELRIVLKADVMGTLEVLRKTLADLSTDEVKINIIHEGVGGINQADVILADASDAVVVGFHVTADPSARLQAESREIEVKVYHIIYRLVEDMKAALSGLLPPEEREIVQGHAEIRQIFKASRLGNIAGCFVTDGVITRNSRLRVFRDNVMIHEGRLESLQRYKDQVREVREGFECGLRVRKFNSFQEGDRVEAYVIEEVARELE